MAVDQALVLIEQGATELPNFEGMDSTEDAFLARRMRERFDRWGPIWRNRLGKLVEDLPPAEECAPHSDLLIPCGSLRAIFGELSAVPDADSLDSAAALVETSRQRLADLQIDLAPSAPAEPEEEGGESAVESSELGAVPTDDDADQVGSEEQGVDLESDGEGDALPRD